MLNKKIFLEAMTGMGEVFGKSLSKVGLDMYYSALSEMGELEFKKACVRIMQNHKYESFPKPAEFLGSDEHMGLKALLELEKAMSSVGAYQSVMFSDQTIMEVVDRLPGGWIGICRMSNEEIGRAHV